MPRLHRIALAAVLAAACSDTRYPETQVSLTTPHAPPPEAVGRARRALRVSVAAVESPQDTYTDYSRLFRRVAERLGLEVEFTQRRSYAEVNDLLAAGELDAALVCTGGYLELRRRAPGAVEVLAVPVVGGKTTYEALVVVPAASPARTVADLVGRRFAYTDPLSLSGHAYVRRYVAGLGQDPDRFFSEVVFTHNHDRSVAAVAQGLVDGAAVHGGVYAHLVRKDPAIAARLRVVHRSPPFPAMPVVASTRLAPETRRALREILLSLASDPDAAGALAVLGMDGFAVAEPAAYDETERAVELPR
jgi:phosphonate transport system substrate-binding protein